MIKHIHGIELSNRCNLACGYCPHPKIHQHREIMDMDITIFVKSMEFIRKVQDRHGKNKLILAMFGESFLHPDFCEYAREVHRFLACPIQIETNGLALNGEHAKVIREIGAKVIISNHSPEKANAAHLLLKSYGIEAQRVAAFLDPKTKHSWAGQAGDWPVEYRGDCSFLNEYRAVIMVDGSVTTCCLDAFGAGVIGTVWDDPQEMTPKRFSLCETCHNGGN